MDVGLEQDVKVLTIGAVELLLGGNFLAHGDVVGHGALHEAGAELPGLAGLLQRPCVQRLGHLLVHGFLAAQHGYLGQLVAQGAEGLHGIDEDLLFLLQIGIGAHAAVGVDDDLVVGVKLVEGQVTHGTAGAQVVLLFHNGTQQVGGLNHALHQEVGVAGLDDLHRLHRRVSGGAGGVHDVKVGGVQAHGAHNLLNLSGIAHQDRLGNALLLGLQNRLDHVLVGGGGYSHHPFLAHALNGGDELVKILQFHLRYLHMYMVLLAD